jgi:CBS-domain-containing membrane protein
MSLKLRLDPEASARAFAELMAVAFFAGVVAAANAFCLVYIAFPELGAVAYDVLTRPNGRWAKEPWKLICTPVLAGVAGVAVSSQLPYGVLSILLAMTLSIGIVYGLKSAVAPAISAGVLPVVLGVSSWLYPVCILCSLAVLTGMLLGWKATGSGKRLIPHRTPDQMAADVLESIPKGKWWLVALFVFVAAAGLAAQLTTWRFILFPPLIVMAYEMFGHPTTCAWAKAPFTFPIVCTLAALVGVVADKYLGATPLAAAIVLAITIGILRVSRLRMPPALAIGLIPFILPSPSLRYALSVGIGTVALTACFLAFRKLTVTDQA